MEFGSGPPLVLIPGIQGRWEYLRPAIDALARSFRVLTFPLSGEPRGGRFDPGLGFDNDARHLLETLDRRGIERAVVCGISFGGLPAIRFAATHPERASALVLTSTPAQPWSLRPRHRLYTSLPWLFGPLFLIESPFRLHQEVAAALPGWSARWRFVRSQVAALARAPLSPTRMAARAALIADADVTVDCACMKVPTLLVTGERALDRVVPVDRTLAYLDLIPGARHVTLDRTGHLGSITRPDEFAALIVSFATSLQADDHPRPDREAGPALTASRGPNRNDSGSGRHRATA